MITASVAHVKAKFSAYVKASGRSPVVVTRHGRAVAAIVALTEEEDLERLMLAYSPKLRAILAAARRRMDSGKGIPHDQFWRQAQAGRRTRAGRKAA
jgi:prevent-host-death family protein